MGRMELYPFRFRDPLTGKWVRARYVAERHEIAARCAEWEITGPPEIRADSGQGYFRPYPPTTTRLVGNVEPRPLLRRDERYLVLLLLPSLERGSRPAFAVLAEPQ